MQVLLIQIGIFFFFARARSVICVQNEIILSYFLDLFLLVTEGFTSYLENQAIK